MNTTASTIADFRAKQDRRVKELEKGVATIRKQLKQLLRDVATVKKGAHAKEDSNEIAKLKKKLQALT